MRDQHRGGPPLVEWFALTIECPDPEALAPFSVAAMGGTITRRIPDCVYVQAPGLVLNFHRSPDYRPTTWPSSEVPLHSHFELVVDDLDSAGEELLSEGATVARHQDADESNIVVMLDPAGNPFCLVRSSVARRP